MVEAEAGGFLSDLEASLELQNEFQDILDYTEKPSFEKTNKKIPQTVDREGIPVPLICAG